VVILKTPKSRKVTFCFTQRRSNRATRFELFNEKSETRKSEKPDCDKLRHSMESDMNYRDAVKTEANRGFAGNRQMERHPSYVKNDPDTIAIAQRFNKSAYDVATDIVAVRLSNDRARLSTS
jgi:hypothetical protein